MPLDDTAHQKQAMTYEPYQQSYHHLNSYELFQQFQELDRVQFANAVRPVHACTAATELRSIGVALLRAPVLGHGNEALDVIGVYL